MIKNGSLVRFEYTLCDDSGDVIQSNRGKDPVSYTHGQHEIIPGLEKGLNGMDVNEEKTFRVQPEEAYGPVDPNAFKEVPKVDVPAAALQVGTPLGTRGPNGEACHSCARGQAGNRGSRFQSPAGRQNFELRRQGRGHRVKGVVSGSLQDLMQAARV